MESREEEFVHSNNNQGINPTQNNSDSNTMKNKMIIPLHPHETAQNREEKEQQRDLERRRKSKMVVLGEHTSDKPKSTVENYKKRKSRNEIFICPLFLTLKSVRFGEIFLTLLGLFGLWEQ